MKEYYVFLPDSLPQLHFVNDTVITPPYTLIERNDICAFSGPKHGVRVLPTVQGWAI